MRYADYVALLRARAGDARVDPYGSVHECGTDYELLCVSTPGEPKLFITAGFHGEEPAGPLTLAEHLPEILADAARMKIGLRIYPCINPSGFELGQRYNLSDEKPNNDFLRYEVAPGELHGELGPNESFLRWTVFEGGPKETRALRQDLERWPVPTAALDIHQDRYCPGAWVYAYTFGETAPYVKLMRASSAHARIAANHPIDEFRTTDSEGLIEFHDGSVTDYFYRRGAMYAATLETTTDTRMHQCHAINLIWIRGFIQLTASRTA